MTNAATGANDHVDDGDRRTAGRRTRICVDAREGVIVAAIGRSSAWAPIHRSDADTMSRRRVVVARGSPARMPGIPGVYPV